ncbi:DUF4350 domain-containing protein [Micromonospora sp. URMC 103]|uniref:DUF4350 domain-containing protein n=1 Tax=Micromonospora sp. URMC 103 TaxID=3423406 RepID=UPI003F1C004D
MTAAPPIPAPARDETAKRPPRRRWHRLAVPLGLAAALVTTTLVTYAVDRPDPTDPGFLSPVETGGHGGSRLAEALRRGGVTVQRETEPAPALRAARTGPATVFVPAPDLLQPDTLARITRLAPGSRLVLVDPSRRSLVDAGLPLTPRDRRWAAKVGDPRSDGRPCPLPELGPVRRAAAQLQRYEADDVADLCFSAGLARLPGATEVVVVGADDPFRNDRIAEWDNQALATGLLGLRGRVVWLDLRRPEPPPPSSSSPPHPDTVPYSEEPGGDGSDGPHGTADGRPGPMPGGDGSPRGGRPQSSADDRQDAGNPLWDAFPVWFWALLVQLALALLLVALWRARRLGPPAPEPLPVTVRSAETTLGRARLYQRAGARGPAGRTLRTAALARLLPWLNLPAGVPPERVSAAVAARTGHDPEQVEELLYGDDPATDADLLDLARSLDDLTRTVAAVPPDRARPADPTGPDPTEGGPR